MKFSLREKEQQQKKGRGIFLIFTIFHFVAAAASRCKSVKHFRVEIFIFSSSAYDADNDYFYTEWDLMVGWGATPLKHFFASSLNPDIFYLFHIDRKMWCRRRVEEWHQQWVSRRWVKVLKYTGVAVMCARCYGNSTFSHFSYPCSCSERVEILSNVKHNSLSGKCTQHDKKASRHDELLRVAGSCCFCFWK